MIDIVTDRFQTTKVSQKIVGSEPKADFNALFKSEGYRFAEQISKMLKNNDINNKEFQKQYSGKIDANTSKIAANSARIGNAENNIQLNNLIVQDLQNDVNGNSQNIDSLVNDVSSMKSQTSSLLDNYTTIQNTINNEAFLSSGLGLEDGNDLDLQRMSSNPHS